MVLVLDYISTGFDVGLIFREQLFPVERLKSTDSTEGFRTGVSNRGCTVHLVRFQGLRKVSRWERLYLPKSGQSVHVSLIG